MTFQTVSQGMAQDLMSNIGAAARVTPPGGPAIETRAREPVQAGAETLQYATARPDWNWVIRLLTADVGTDIKIGTLVEYLEGPHTGETWEIVDIPLDGIVPPTALLPAVRQP